MLIDSCDVSEHDQLGRNIFQPSFHLGTVESNKVPSSSPAAVKSTLDHAVALSYLNSVVIQICTTPESKIFRSYSNHIINFFIQVQCMQYDDATIDPTPFVCVMDM